MSYTKSAKILEDYFVRKKGWTKADAIFTNGITWERRDDIGVQYGGFVFFKKRKINGLIFIEVTGHNDYTEPWLHVLYPLTSIKSIHITPIDKLEKKEANEWQR